MKKHLLWLLGLWMLCTGVQAQDESFKPASIPGASVLLDTAFLMPPLSKREFGYYFRKKGTAFLDMVVADKELLYVEVEEVPGIYLYSRFKVQEIKTDSLKNEAHSQFRFKFRNGSALPRYCNIKIRHRISPIEATYVIRDTIYVDTITGAPIYVNATTEKSIVDKTPHIKVKDSIFLEPIEIVNTKLTIGPQRDLAHESKAILPFQLPTDQTVYGWAYWIGVGDGAVTHFDGLSALLPEDWVKDGIETPLHAFSKELINRIPKTNIGEKIEFIITDSVNAVQFLENRKLEKTESFSLGGTVMTNVKVENTRKIEGISFVPPIPSQIKSILVDYNRKKLDVEPENKMYVCLMNTNTVTALTVTIKIVALVEKISFKEQANQN